MVVERVSPLKLNAVEAALRRAVRRRRASVAAVEPAGATIVFTILQPDLYSMLLSAEVRFAAFLPCRIAAYPAGDGVKLVAMSPVEFVRALPRPDLEGIATAAENLLNEILEETAHPVMAATGGHAESGWGATEDQVNMRGALPQRIDKRGSKLEEIAGTGQHDSHGG